MRIIEEGNFDVYTNKFLKAFVKHIAGEYRCKICGARFEIFDSEVVEQIEDKRTRGFFNSYNEEFNASYYVECPTCRFGYYRQLWVKLDEIKGIYPWYKRLFGKVQKY